MCDLQENTNTHGRHIGYKVTKLIMWGKQKRKWLMFYFEIIIWQHFFFVLSFYLLSFNTLRKTFSAFVLKNPVATSRSMSAVSHPSRLRTTRIFGRLAWKFPQAGKIRGSVPMVRLLHRIKRFFFFVGSSCCLEYEYVSFAIQCVTSNESHWINCFLVLQIPSFRCSDYNELELNTWRQKEKKHYFSTSLVFNCCSNRRFKRVLRDAIVKLVSRSTK